MKILLDTDVMVAALLSATGASRRILRAGIDRRIGVLVSTTLMFEYADVLKRKTHLAAAGATAGDVDVILDMLAATAELVEMDYLWRPQLTDAADEMVLETAVNGGADFLVTFNARDFGVAPSKFGIAVTRPSDLIGRV